MKTQHINEYRGWRQVIQATWDNTSPDGNKIKRAKSSDDVNKTQNQQEQAEKPTSATMKIGDKPQRKKKSATV